MKYNSMKKQAFNNWKRDSKTPQWAKINKRKRVYEADYYTTLNNLQSTLIYLGYDFKKAYLENLGNYIYDIKDIIVPTTICRYSESDQLNLYRQYFGFHSSIHHYDKTGYDVHWKLEEINYSVLAEKMYNITEKNKIMCLGGNRWLVWTKIK